MSHSETQSTNFLTSSVATGSSDFKYDGRELSTDGLRSVGEEINRLYSWQWTKPLVNEEQWIVAEKMLCDSLGG